MELTKRLEDKLRVCRIILSELERPNRWTPLFKAVLSHSPTPWKFRSALEWLLEKGYVSHHNRGLYEITDAGRQFLKALCISSNE